MTPRELERLERDSIYTLRINSDLKDSVIQLQLNELVKVVKREVKGKKLVVFIIDTK